MRIKECGAEDEEAIIRLHRSMGAGWDLPRLDAPSLVSAWMLVDDDGIPAQAILGRATLEAYYLIDHKRGTPEERLQWLRDLHMIGQADATVKGFSDIHSFVEHERFAKRLVKQFGWEKTRYPAYVFKMGVI